MKNDERTLLLRSFDEDLGEIESAELNLLLERSVDARAERARIGRMREMLASNAAASFDPNFADRVLRHVAALEGPRKQQAPRATHLQQRMERLVEFVRSWRFATGMAAATAVALALAVVTWLMPVSISVPNGEMRTVTLGDGSEVELSGGSSVSYLRFWGRSERHVSLEGEAFFKVVEDARPFIVETFNANVTVLGTEFNVRAWRSDPRPQTQVAVTSGRVAVEPHGQSPHKTTREEALPPQELEESLQPQEQDESLQSQEQDAPQQPHERPETLRSAPPGGRAESGQTRFAVSAERPLVLEPGQAATVAADSIVALRRASLDRVLAWRSGGLAFVDQPLGSVFNTLERRFGVEVEAATPEINQRLLTYLNPQPQSPAAVLADICHTLDLRYRRTADGFEVLTTPDE